MDISEKPKSSSKAFFDASANGRHNGVYHDYFEHLSARLEKLLPSSFEREVTDSEISLIVERPYFSLILAKENRNHCSVYERHRRISVDDYAPDRDSGACNINERDACLLFIAKVALTFPEKDQAKVTKFLYGQLDDVVINRRHYTIEPVAP